MNPSQFINTGNSPEQSNAPMDDEKTMPIGVSDFHDEPGSGHDPLAGAGSSRKLNTGSFVIVLVIVVAIGGLWGMRKLTHVKASTGANSEVERTIEKFLSALTGGDGQGQGDAVKPISQDNAVLDVLKETYTERQVPLTDVQRNPFILDGEIFVKTLPGEAPADGSAGAAKQRAERQAEFERGAGGLHLKSVIMGAEPLANISGKIVRVGEEIVSNAGGPAYRVSKITADAVTVVAEDHSLNLTVEVVLTIKRFN